MCGPGYHDHHTGDRGMLKSWKLTATGHGFSPGPPEVATTTPVGGGGFTVVWTAPSDTGSSAVTSYDLRYIQRRRPGPLLMTTGPCWKNVWTSGALSYSLTGLEGDVEYVDTGAGGHRHRQRTLVEGRVRETRDGGAAGAVHQLGLGGQPRAVRRLDRAGWHRRRRHNLVRHPPYRDERRRDGRCQLDGTRPPLDVRPTGVRRHRTGQRHGVRRAGAGCQLGGRRRLVGDGHRHAHSGQRHRQPELGVDGLPG